MANNKKSNRWAVVINPTKEKPTREVLEGYLPTLLCYNKYSFIATVIHDRDKLKDGTTKTIHAHALIETTLPATKKAFLEELVQLLGINAEQVSIEPSNSNILPVQYLIHKNDKDKTPYEVSEVKTNDAEELNKRLGQEYKQRSLMDVLKEAKTATEVAELIGPQEAIKYLRLFKEIKSEQRQDYQSIYDQLSEQIELNNRLHETIDDLQAQVTKLKRKLESYENLKKY